MVRAYGYMWHSNFSRSREINQTKQSKTSINPLIFIVYFNKGFYATTFLKFWEDIIQGQKARLKSPTIASAKCVEFYYFMAGTTVGELLVYLKSASQGEKVVWQLIGDQGYQWQRGAFPVNSTYKNFNVCIYLIICRFSRSFRLCILYLLLTMYFKTIAKNPQIYA